MNVIRFTLVLLSVGLFTHCDPPKKKQVTLSPQKKTNKITPKKSVEETDSKEEKEKPKVKPHVVLPYTKAPELKKYLTKFTKPIGSISGENFGEDSELLALSKVQCGEGSVLQALFRNEKGVQISPPIPLKFIGLQTEKDLHYTEDNFEIHINFAKDNGESLKGELKIQYTEKGIQKKYIQLKVDGPVQPYLMEPKMKGKGHLPSYDWCAANAFLGIQHGNKWTYGYAHIHNIKNLNIPLIRVMLSDREGIDVLLVPLTRNLEIPKDTVINVESGRVRGKNPAVLKLDAWRIDEIFPAKEATRANLNTLQKTAILDGKARVSLTKYGKKSRKKSQPWAVEINIENFSISSRMTGPFQDEHFEQIRIFGLLGKKDEMKSRLLSPPSWWVDPENHEN